MKDKEIKRDKEWFIKEINNVFAIDMPQICNFI